MQLPSMSKKMAWGILVMALLVPAAAQASGARSDEPGLKAVEPTLLASVRPDDRAGIRGIETNAATTLAVRPDDRAGLRGAAPDVVDRYLRSHASPTASSASSASSSQGFAWFDSAWFDSAIAAAIVLAALSIAAAGLHLIRRPAHAR